MFLTAGSRFYICNPTYAGEPPAWVEIAGMETLGAPGIEWETEESMPTLDEAQVLTLKTVRRSPVMQISMAAIDDDPGQQLLWAAARGTDDACFRLDFPNSGSQRFWEAAVTAMSESVEEADNVVRAIATLAINSTIYRHEGLFNIGDEGPHI